MLGPPLALLAVAAAMIGLALFMQPGDDATVVTDPELPPLTLTYHALTVADAMQLPPGLDPGPVCAPKPKEGDPPHVQSPPPWRDKAAVDLSDRLVAYFADLHSHTALSDAEAGTPVDAYRYARDVAKLDVFAVTDHPEYWLLRQADRYEQQKKVVQEEARPGFVPMLGFEYSSTLYGHYVVLNAPHARSSFQDATVQGFYDWLARPEQKDALVWFAHPGFHEYRKKTEFDRFELAPGIVDKMIGLEVIHWDGYQRGMKGYGGKYPFVDEALRRGWRVGAIASEDNHSPNWGTRDSFRIGLLLPRLGHDEVTAALKARHFYATSNKDLQFAFDVRKKDGRWAMMGDSLRDEDLPADATELRVRYYDRDCADWPTKMDVVVNGKVVGEYQFAKRLAPTDPFPVAGEVSATLPLGGAHGKRFYAYVRFYQGDETYTESSPLFFDLDQRTR